MASLEDGKQYKLSYIMPGLSYNDVTTYGVADPYPLELMSMFSEEFSVNLAKLAYLKIIYEGKVSAILSLTGVPKILPTMVSCAQDQYRKAKTDPFAK